jgi:hypothetical protein
MRKVEIFTALYSLGLCRMYKRRQLKWLKQQEVHQQLKDMKHMHDIVYFLIFQFRCIQQTLRYHVILPKAEILIQLI